MSPNVIVESFIIITKYFQFLQLYAAGFQNIIFRHTWCFLHLYPHLSLFHHWSELLKFLFKFFHMFLVLTIVTVVFSSLNLAVLQSHLWCVYYTFYFPVASKLGQRFHYLILLWLGKTFSRFIEIDYFPCKT